MSLDEIYNEQRTHFMNQMAPNKNIQPVLLELMKSKNYQSWKILQELLIKTEEQQKGIFRRILEEVIERNIEAIQNFSMFLYVYSIKVNKKLSYFGSYKWSRTYRQLAQKLEVAIFTSWVQSDPTSTIVQQTLKLVGYIFPIFHKQQYILLTEIEMSSIIEWVSYFQTSTAEEYEDSCKLVRIGKQSRTIIKQDFVEKEHVIIKRLIQICGKNKNISPNIFLFLYPIDLKQKDISYFCHLYSDFLTEITEQNICNFFIAITKSAISLQILQIISKISLFLKNEQEYYKLQYLFENYVLPILCRRMKTCNKNKIQQNVYDICEFYIMGFLKTLCLGINGIQCIARNLSKIKNDKIRQKWLFLCDVICAQYPQLKPSVQKHISKQFKKQIYIEIGEYEKIRNNPEIVWDITIRNSKKLKRYAKIPSKLKGIKNQQNQCYIITVVQALQKGVHLKKLISKNIESIKTKRCELLDELCILFAEISGQKQAKEITVRYLKNKGPIQYKDSVNQEDSYQYLGHLLESLEKEMSLIPKMLEQFKNLYQIKCSSVNICKNCQNKNQNELKSYVYSIHNTEMLKQETAQIVSDFYCQNCNQKTEAQIRTKLVPECKILIVQINRFSYQKGVSKKQLSTQTILRNFLQYTLVGMICHRGKNIEHGHYVFYHRINSRRWILFNDSAAEQFELDAEDEQFEREWKAEMTPFILFYQDIDQ